MQCVPVSRLNDAAPALGLTFSQDIVQKIVVFVIIKKEKSRKRKKKKEKAVFTAN